MIILFGCISIICIVIVIYKVAEEKRLLKSLSEMLDKAIGGSFAEKDYDETMLSEVEAKMVRFLDESKLKTQQKEEDRARIKSLIADISHQTKTPLSNIILYTELLKEEQHAFGESEKADFIIQELGRQSKKLQELISGLVKMSRLEQGIIQVQPSRQNVMPLIHEIERQILLKAKKKKIQITIPKDEDEDETQAIFDAKWTEEALYNIIDNAVKYTAAGGRIDVRMQMTTMFLRIDITDNGKGIKEEDQAKIFSRFYRASNSKDEEGVGIGLYLARKIIHEEGGYIKLISQYGKGSDFAVFLRR